MIESLGLRGRITLHPAPREWLLDAARKYHYMHKAPAYRANPFGWRVAFDDELDRPDGKPCGFIVFQTPHFTRLKGEFGYAGLPTHWQVLCLSRLWLHDDLPFNSETVVIGKALRLAPRRWLEVHPPARPDEPYEIKKVVTFADLTAGFRGTIYEAANFRLSGESVSKPRHGKATRGGLDTQGHHMKRYIYDITKAPEPVGVQLALFGDDEEAPGMLPFFLARWWRAHERIVAWNKTKFWKWPGGAFASRCRPIPIT